MPMTPEELNRKRLSTYTPAIDKLIAEIDAGMLSGFDGNRFTWKAIPKSPFFIDAIFKAYKAKGWEVRWVDDQRSGIYWEFTPKGTDEQT